MLFLIFHRQIYYLRQSLIYSESHLREFFSEYANYYNQKRCHQSLRLDAPLTKFEEPLTQNIPAYKKKKMVRGTATEFCLAS